MFTCEGTDIHIYICIACAEMTSARESTSKWMDELTSINTCVRTYIHVCRREM